MRPRPYNRQREGEGWRVGLALWLLLGGLVALWLVGKILAGAYLDILGAVAAVVPLLVACYYIIRF
jgi:hypothetical protein